MRHPLGNSTRKSHLAGRFVRGSQPHFLNPNKTNNPMPVFNTDSATIVSIIENSHFGCNRFHM